MAVSALAVVERPAPAWLAEPEHHGELDGGGQVVFGGMRGWLHRPHARAAGPSDVAVVVCPPVGRDARCAHLFLRELAERMAGAGYAALRFDYRGCGDSLDLPDGADAIAAWRADVRAAVAAARATTGLQRVVLCGFRLGATLAALEAGGVAGVDGLMLLAPIEQGRRWLRELKLAAALSTPAHRHGPPAGETAGAFALESDGLQLTAATVASLEALELARMGSGVGETLLAAPSPTPALTGRLHQAAESLVEQGFPGLAALLDETHSNPVPEETLQAAVDWLAARFPLTAVRAPRAMPATLDGVLHPPGCVERGVSFGEGLQGVLCRPERARPGAAQRIALLCNTGGDPRVGAGRFSVDAARTLARAGVASLRFDFAGLGDSPREGGRGHVYAVSRERDLHDAVGFARELGYGEPVLAGVCTGAYHAFWAAARDPRVAGLFMVSLVKFTWRDGDSLDFGRRDEAAATRTYLQRLRCPATWARLLGGQVRVGAIARSLAQRTAAQAGVRARGGDRPVRDAARRISARGARAELLIGLEDAAMDELETYFGRRGRAWAAQPGLGLHVHPSLDHPLFRASSREVAVERLVRFMTA